jgi:hypothetical protein
MKQISEAIRLLTDSNVIDNDKRQISLTVREKDQVIIY